jgi:DNA-binding response OmpR family regulator/Tfp pilus assembly protein PilZ
MDPRILVVDDDSLIRHIMRDALEALPATVLEAAEGSEALRLACAEVPDLIVLDTMMPGMDGFQVAEALKREAATADIPLIFASALGTSSHKVRGLDMGAEDYLSKPIDPEELKARVRIILRRTRRAPAPPPAAPATITTGQLHAMPLPALVRWIELEHRSARLSLTRDGEQGEICFVEGRIVAALQGGRHGEAAVYQLLTWQEGGFQILPDPGTPPAAADVHHTNEELLKEGTRRLEEIPDLLDPFPGSEARFEVPAGLRDGLARELAGAEARLVSLLDATRSLEQVLAESPFDAWTTLKLLQRLLRLAALGWAPAPGTESAVAPRRAVPRVPLLAPVRYQPLRDMAQSNRFLLYGRGVFIQTATPYAVGEQVLLRFQLPERGEWINLAGQVMWGNVESKGKPDDAGMGLQFVEISPKDLAAVEDALTKSIAAALRQAAS